MTSITEDSIRQIAEAAADRSPVRGTTHGFYRYPARFSPVFVAEAIEQFSAPGDLVLDPYMGGGTTVVEAVRARRQVIGNDLNSLAVFLAKTKSTPLSRAEIIAVSDWASKGVAALRYSGPTRKLASLLSSEKLRNMTLVRARFIKKIMAGAIAQANALPTDTAKNFARCVVLKTGQWALDGRKSHTSLQEFREKLAANAAEMIEGIEQFAQDLRLHNITADRLRHLRQGDASTMDQDPTLHQFIGKVSLVITSPPYPGVHVLYHRWQVDGRRETAAPYWVADCNDGQGASFYNFGGRHEEGLTTYFESSLTTLRAVRRMMKKGGLIVQMVAFSDPNTQLGRYLGNMENAGFIEVSPSRAVGAVDGRIWRSVPGRKWHANLRGDTSSSREVVIIHRAV